MMTNAPISNQAAEASELSDVEAGIWPSDDDLLPWPDADDDLTANIAEASLLTFAAEGEEGFRTTCGEILVAYRVACAWKRVPSPGLIWEAELPQHLRLITHGQDGELLSDFSARDNVTARDEGFAWFCGVETNPKDASCEVCGSELFLIFIDARGKSHRLERLTLLTAILNLNALGDIPQLPSEIYRLLELEYDHICHSEHVLLGLGRGEPDFEAYLNPEGSAP